jgi:hypothetical protein
MCARSGDPETQRAVAGLIENMVSWSLSAWRWSVREHCWNPADLLELAIVGPFVQYYSFIPTQFPPYRSSLHDYVYDIPRRDIAG